MEVLISTMKKNNLKFLDSMNIQTDVIVANQSDSVASEILDYNDHKVKFITTKTRGVSYNRNICLENATDDICLISDDDLCFMDGLEDKVLKAFKDNPRADIIVFNIKESPVRRYVIKKKYKVNFFNYMRFGAVRIAFRRSSVMNKKIRFDLMFGPGASVPQGEDTIFLHDCLRARLHIVAVPEYILTLKNDRESTWFKGYDEQFFTNKGKLFRRISKHFGTFLCLQDAIRHRKLYEKKWTYIFKKEMGK